MSIRSVGVLGAGTMGAQIALHIANAGVPSVLLDVSRDAARHGLDRARRLKPDPQFTPDAWTLITTGSFDEDLARLAAVDWVVEAVVEQLEVKRALLERVAAVCRPDTVLSTNTSGIPVAAIAEGWPAERRARFMGTHFFNPPRYLHLLEQVLLPDCDADRLDPVVEFCDRVLGKGVVLARDTPNFIGNHLALHGVVSMLRAVESGRYTIDEVDAITGRAIGRPASATFRTADIAGLDVLMHVLGNLEAGLPNAGDRAWFRAPGLLARLVASGALGEKTGRGFYERRKAADGQSAIFTFDPASGDYVPQRKPAFPSIEAARTIDDTGARVRTLFNGSDRVGQFLRETLAPTLVYCARVQPDIAHEKGDVDRVMRWGFGWDLGPFELMDAIGVRDVMAAAAAHGVDHVPAAIQEVFDGGRTTFRDGPLPPAHAGMEILRRARQERGVVATNPGASLIDLGDGVLCVEFHSKMNVIGGDTIAMLHQGVREAARNHRALVVGGEAAAFSAGANLMLVLLEAQEGNWDEIDQMVRAFQQCCLALRYSDVPVVAAPAGLALGGGCEVVLHCDRVQAAAETYLGLVEVGVGLIPAGGGTKEMVARAMHRRPSAAAGPLAAVQTAFETVALAKVSASAPDATRLGYFTASDGVTMNRQRLIADAKAVALARAEAGYRPPPPRAAIPVGGESLAAALKLGVHLAWRAGRASDHDALIGRTLATLMAGGAVPHATTISEQHFLDLEREAFLKLLGEPKTLARIQHTLSTGKPLRN
jgi:3-hydroxyacyl-CoA dehydrogenase